MLIHFCRLLCLLWCGISSCVLADSQETMGAREHKVNNIQDQYAVIIHIQARYDQSTLDIPVLPGEEVLYQGDVWNGATKFVSGDSVTIDFIGEQAELLAQFHLALPCKDSQVYANQRIDDRSIGVHISTLGGGNWGQKGAYLYTIDSN